MKIDKETPNLCRKSVKTGVKEEIIFQLRPGGCDITYSGKEMEKNALSSNRMQ